MAHYKQVPLPEYQELQFRTAHNIVENGKNEDRYNQHCEDLKGLHSDFEAFSLDPCPNITRGMP